MTITRLRKGTKIRERTVYQGHVILKQGPITIQAATTILRLDSRGLLLFARALGNPVHFRRNEKRGPPIVGTSRLLTYDPATTTYHLIGHVHVIRGGQSIVAHEITYDTATGILVAVRGHRHRIHMVIPPRHHKPGSP